MIKKDERARFTLRIPERLLNKLEAVANEQGVSTNALILHILWDWSEEQKQHKEVS